MAGIIFQWYIMPSPWLVWLLLIAGSFILALENSIGLYFHFEYAWITGLLIHTGLFALGMLVCSRDAIEEDPDGIKKRYLSGALVMAEIHQPFTERKNSFMSIASGIKIRKENKTVAAKGKILIIIEKNAMPRSLLEMETHAQIVFRKDLSPIRNSGNPGAYEYQAYASMQQIYFQIFLGKGDFIYENERRSIDLSIIINRVREKILSIIRVHIHGEKESGLAEALLVGYKGDLDGELVRSYTNTGVVHIIAISGLHLALIYGLLKMLTNPMRRLKVGKFAAMILIIASLWFFSFLSGASPSVLRSAVMFSFLVLGELVSKHSSIYNTLSASAFLLLCFNPFWLWDLSFQLSYLAVLSIVIFYKPIYHSIFVAFRIPRLIWQSIALTLAAQILTIPICILQFHQFPLYFLPTNLFAVPWSSIVLIGAIVLCCISSIPALAAAIGNMLSKAIWVLNSYIETLSNWPYSIWDHLQITWQQAMALYLFIAGIAWWRFQRSKHGLLLGLLSILCFLCVRLASIEKASGQHLLVIYNIPHHQAVDCIIGRKSVFLGDKELNADQSLIKFYLWPTRVLYRINSVNLEGDETGKIHYFTWGRKKLLIIDSLTNLMAPSTRVSLDVLIISKNPKLTIKSLATVFDVGCWVFDRTNSGNAVRNWKKECEKFEFKYQDLSTSGAFVMNMD
ncbi:MAG: ComEC/Rec2 family competence protein [Chitinophagales bacterium]